MQLCHDPVLHMPSSPVNTVLMPLRTLQRPRLVTDYTAARQPSAPVSLSAQPQATRQHIRTLFGFNLPFCQIQRSMLTVVPSA
jgi:hypothetical protein